MRGPRPSLPTRNTGDGCTLSIMEDRIEREKTLQDQRFGVNGGSRGTVDRAYSITTDSHAYFKARLAEFARGKRVLEIGSGAGENALELSSTARRVSGIDLSEVAVEIARRKAREHAVHNVAFEAMNAEHMDFPESSFDIVCGGAILHHLALEEAYSEIARVLDPSGCGLFIEPLGYNPLINLYRRLTPKIRTPDEHPLLERDLALARTFFGRVDIRYYYLTTLLALPIARTTFGMSAVKALNAVDRVLFRYLPAMRRYAWIMVIELRQPVKGERAQSA